MLRGMYMSAFSLHFQQLFDLANSIPNLQNPPYYYTTTFMHFLRWQYFHYLALHYLTNVALKNKVSWLRRPNFFFLKLGILHSCFQLHYFLALRINLLLFFPPNFFSGTIFNWMPKTNIWFTSWRNSFILNFLH